MNKREDLKSCIAYEKDTPCKFLIGDVDDPVHVFCRVRNECGRGVCKDYRKE